jgi:hypothetical protein
VQDDLTMLLGETKKPAIGKDARLTGELRQCLRCTPEPCVEEPHLGVIYVTITSMIGKPPQFAVREVAASV